MLTLTKHPAIHPVETIPHLKTKGVTVAISYRQETVVGAKQEALKCIIETFDIFEELVSIVHLVDVTEHMAEDFPTRDQEHRLSIPVSAMLHCALTSFNGFCEVRY